MEPGFIPDMVAGTLAILGISYTLQTTRWIGLTRTITAQPERFFPAAVVMVAAGLALGGGYNNWSGTWPTFVTLLGYLLALEGAVILLFPSLIRKFQTLPDAFLRSYIRIGGIVLLALAILLWKRVGE